MLIDIAFVTFMSQEEGRADLYLMELKEACTSFFKTAASLVICYEGTLCNPHIASSMGSPTLEGS